METQVITVSGNVRDDGTLEVSEKLNLPAGRVQVTVQSATEPVQPERFWTMMETIWKDLQAAGHKPRTREEIDAEINALREEAEEEMQKIERLQESHLRKEPGR
jgi:hypothetical protein